MIAAIAGFSSFVHACLALRAAHVARRTPFTRDRVLLWAAAALLALIAHLAAMLALWSFGRLVDLPAWAEQLPGALAWRGSLAWLLTVGVVVPVAWLVAPPSVVQAVDRPLLAVLEPAE